MILGQLSTRSERRVVQNAPRRPIAAPVASKRWENRSDSRALHPYSAVKLASESRVHRERSKEVSE